MATVQSIPITAEKDPSGRWIVVLEEEVAGSSVRVIHAAKKRTEAVLTPTDYLPSGFDFPWHRWANGSEGLAVALAKGLWVWWPGRRSFRNVAPWHWQGNEAGPVSIAWSTNNEWVLRYVTFRALGDDRETRFECVNVFTGEVVPAEVSYARVTTAEWLDDELAFAINVAVNAKRGIYRTVHVDAQTGRKTAEFD